MNNHTTANLGKRVHVILHSGESFVDKVIEMRDRRIGFENHGRVLTRDIRSLSIWRPSTSPVEGANRLS
jgi:hypothetical protein